MITDCFSGWSYGTNVELLPDVLEFMTVVSPGVLGIVLWRIFVTNRSGPVGGVVVLGLDDSSYAYSNRGLNEPRWLIRFAYCAVSLTTFGLGLVASEVTQTVLSLM